MENGEERKAEDQAKKDSEVESQIVKDQDQKEEVGK